MDWILWGAALLVGPAVPVSEPGWPGGIAVPPTRPAFEDDAVPGRSMMASGGVISVVGVNIGGATRRAWRHWSVLPSVVPLLRHGLLSLMLLLLDGRQLDRRGTLLHGLSYRHLGSGILSLRDHPWLDAGVHHLEPLDCLL